MGKVRRPTPFVRLNEKGEEMSDFGKGIDEIMAKRPKEDDATKAELKKLFGESAEEFDKPNIPLNEKGEPIDNRKITITNIRPSVPVGNTKG